MCIRNQPLPVGIISTDWEMVELLDQFASLLAWWKTEAEAEKIKVKLCVPEQYSHLFVQQTVTIYWHIWLVKQVSIWTGTQVSLRLVSVCLFVNFRFVSELSKWLIFWLVSNLGNYESFLVFYFQVVQAFLFDHSLQKKNEDKINRLNALIFVIKPVDSRLVV